MDRPILAAFLAIVTVSTAAIAQEPGFFDGTWRQSPLVETYTVREWQDSCGPRPQNGSQGGGETVTITSQGDELLFSGGGRPFRTTECTDPTPRDAHSRGADGKSFRTHCATPAGDPRRAVLSTSISGGENRIDLVETGTYEVTLKDGRCLADVRRTRSWTSIAHAAKAPPPPVVEPPKPPPVVEPPKPAHACDGPRGVASKLEVRPSKKLLRPGEKFNLRGVLSDEAGCPVEGKIDYAAEKGAPLTVDGRGVVETKAEAAPGEYAIVVSSGGRETKMIVQIVAADRYDALLAEEGLDAEGERKEGASVALPPPVGGGGEAKSDDPGKRRKMLFLAIVGGLAVPLGILAFVLLKRKARAEAAAAALEARHAERLSATKQRNDERKNAYEAELRAHEESLRNREEVAARKRAEREAAEKRREAEAAARAQQKLACPVCRREYEPPMAHCPEDGTKLEAPPTDEGPSGLVCPICTRGFAVGVKVCPTHGEELVAATLIATRATEGLKGKICPVCGDKFDGTHKFCGKDGAALVLLN